MLPGTKFHLNSSSGSGVMKNFVQEEGGGFIPPCTLERLTDFMSLISLYTPLKHQKTSGFIINKSVTRYALQINATGFYMLVSLVLLKAHSQV